MDPAESLQPVDEPCEGAAVERDLLQMSERVDRALDGEEVEGQVAEVVADRGRMEEPPEGLALSKNNKNDSARRDQ